MREIDTQQQQRRRASTASRRRDAPRADVNGDDDGNAAVAAAASDAVGAFDLDLDAGTDGSRSPEPARSASSGDETATHVSDAAAADGAERAGDDGRARDDDDDLFVDDATAAAGAAAVLMAVDAAAYAPAGAARASGVGVGDYDKEGDEEGARLLLPRPPDDEVFAMQSDLVRSDSYPVGRMSAARGLFAVCYVRLHR